MNNPKTSRWWIAVRVLFTLVLVILPGISLAKSEEGPAIHLQYASFDPLNGEPGVPNGLEAPSQAGESSLYLLQFSGPVLEEWKAAVEAVGVRLYGYIPDYAFIARIDPAALEQVRGFNFVRWVGVYQPAYRLSAALQEVSDTPTEISVQTLPDVDLNSLADQVRSLGGEVENQAANAEAGYLRVRLPMNQLNNLAALDGVLWVEPYQPPVLLNDKSGGTIIQANSARTSLGLFGNGQIVGVADSGLDTGSLENLHMDVRGRVIKTYCLGRPLPCDWSDYAGHGTHVIGSVLGSGMVSGSNPATHQYVNTYAGIAPEARLVLQSLGDATGGLNGIPADVGQLMRDAYKDGVRVHTNSWGSSAFGAYTTSSAQVDQAAWELKDLLVLFAAGNSGADTDKNGVVDLGSLASPASAKNILAVGASESDRANIQDTWGSSFASPISSDLRADKINGMAAFSSRGPTRDGRIKPEIVAPGTYIASTRTQKYIFFDNLDGAILDYGFATLNGGSGPTNNWQRVSDDTHSPGIAWREVVSNNSTLHGANLLLTPLMDVRPTGGVFDVSFWHKYSLNAGDKLLVLILDPVAKKVQGITLANTGTQSTYTFQQETLSLNLFSPAPSQVRIAFGIESNSNSPTASKWWLDDIRVDGAGWSSMSQVHLAQPGDGIDQAYVMEGGTSMATPLTAGSAALAREWLSRYRGILAPSAALLKGMLLNGAVDMSPGQYGTGLTQEIPNQRPNNVSGWGRVNLQESLNPPLPRKIWVSDNTSGLTTGVTATYTLSLSSVTTLNAASLEAAYQEHNPLPYTLEPIPSEAEPGKALDTGPEASTAPDAVQLLQNPGFESGAWAPWEATSGAALTNTVQHSGAWSAKIGGSSALGHSEVVQGLFLPVGTTAATIDFWYRLQTMETNPGADYLCYAMWLSSGAPAWGHCFADIGKLGSIGWTKATYNLTASELAAVVGKNVHFGFQVQNNASLPSTAWIDDTSLNASASGGPFRITLAWTDYPGQSSASRDLVNDLDLEVIGPGNQHFIGNAGAYTVGGSFGSCLRDGKWDACNNVESLVISQAFPGTYTVRVRGTNIPKGPQPFALVASGDGLRDQIATAHQIYMPLISQKR